MAEAAAALDMHPMFVDLEPAWTVLEGYPEAELDRKVFTLIAGNANSKGVSYPTIKTMAEKLGETAKRVWQSVQRLIAKQLLRIIKKEKKYKDIHPRNIYQIVKALLRTEPDKQSSHFDAEKWRVIAARLKKFVADAMDTVKQVAVDAAQKMAKKPRKPRKQWKQRSSENKSYYSYKYMKAAPIPYCTGENTPEPNPVDRRIQDMLSEKGFHVTDPAFTKIGLWMLDRLTGKSKPEDYDAMFQQAVEKFAITLPRVSHPADSRSHSDAVRGVRLVSPEDEPKILGGVLGAAFA